MYDDGYTDKFLFNPCAVVNYINRVRKSGNLDIELEKD